MSPPPGENLKSSKVETYYEAGEAGNEGKIQFPDGSKYEGGLFEGKMHGDGRLEFADGYTYTGSWQKGQMHGSGHLEYKTGDEYIGEFFEGMKHGSGKFVGINGATYEGDWKRDVITGKGKIIYPDGHKYHGEFLDADKHGQGECWYANGAHYKGEWSHNKRHGKGILIYASGATYDGDWVQGKYQGIGSYLYPCGDTYIGDFSDDKKHGNGIYTWGSGEKSEISPSTTPKKNASSRQQGDLQNELLQEATLSAGNPPSEKEMLALPIIKNNNSSPISSMDSERQRLFKKAELIRNNRAKAFEAEATSSANKGELFHHAAEVVGEATTLDNASFDDLLVAEHNFARTKPAKYAEDRVRPLLARIDANKNITFNSGLKINSKEGATAVNTLLLDLTKRSPCAPLDLDYALSRAASEHCRDLCTRGIVDNTEEHTGFDGSNLLTRIQRHGSVLHSAENITNTHNHHVDIVLSLLIDDGLPSRSHRKNILDPKFTTIGCSPCTPSSGKYITVFNYATGFTKLEEE